MPWKAVSCSARGTSHERRNIPCQDYAKADYLELQDALIGAVADGAGSAKHSDIGAKIAVEESLKVVKANFGDFSALFASKAPSKNDFQQVFQKVFELVTQSIRKVATEKSYPVDGFACTLLLFVATREWLTAMQIGDGQIVVQSDAEPDYQLWFQPEKGEYVNETIFITSKDAAKMKVDFKKVSVNFICASTDGIESISLQKIKEKQWQFNPHSPFYKQLQDLLNDKPAQEVGKEVFSLLVCERVNRKTEDDKTLLICNYKNEGKSEIENQTKTLADQAKNQMASKRERNVRDSSSQNLNDYEAKRQNSQLSRNSETARQKRPDVDPYLTKILLNRKTTAFLVIVLTMVSIVNWFNQWQRTGLIEDGLKAINLDAYTAFNRATKTIYISDASKARPAGFLIVQFDENNPSLTNAWVHVPLEGIDTKDYKLKEDGQDRLFPIYLYPEEESEKKEPVLIGYLYSGNYVFYKVKNIPDKEEERRVKLSLTLDR